MGRYGGSSMKKQRPLKGSNQLSKNVGPSLNDEKKIFISHAAQDEPIIVRPFIDDILLGALNVKYTDIFCTSADGMKVESGEDWRNAIKESIQNSKITFLFITPNYKESEMCLNEMGAAWVLSGKVIPLIVDPINYKTVGILQNINQIENLQDEPGLCRIRDIVRIYLEIPSDDIKSDRWTTQTKKFLNTIKKNIEYHPFQPPLDRKIFDRTISDHKELELTVESLRNELEQLRHHCDQLRKIKDAEEIKVVDEYFENYSDLENFESLCKIVQEKLKPFHSIIIGIIYKTFTGKNMMINIDRLQDKIHESIAREFVTEDFEADW
jgi:hypothetical protein